MSGPSAAAREAKAARIVEYVVGPGAESCPDVETFKADFATRPCAPSWTGAGGSGIRLRFERSGSGLKATYAVGDGRPSTKEVASRDCAGLASLAVSAIAFLIDPCPPPPPKPLHIDGVTPQSVVRGAKATLTIDGVGFEPGATVDLSGDLGEEVTTFLDAETLEVSCDVPLTAATEAARDVMVKNPGGRSTVAPGAFAVVPVPTPRLHVIAPGEAVKGDDLVVEISGADFQPNATIAFAGSDIRLVETTYVSSTVLRARIAIAAATDDFRARDVTVTNPDGDATAATIRDAFTVADTPPRVSHVSPPRAVQGTEVTLDVHGTGFQPDAEVALGGEGRTLLQEGTVFVSPELLRVRVRLGEDAPIGAKDVTVRNVRGRSRHTSPAAFTVVEKGGGGDLRRGVPVFVAAEGAQGFWSGGSHGEDEHFQSDVWAGEMSAGGESDLSKGYTLDVLISGYGARQEHRRDYQDLEIYGRHAKDGGIFVRQSIGATALRAMVRRDLDDTGVSLGLVAGGLRQEGCHHRRTKDWNSPLCGDLQQWAAFPAFGLRMGEADGAHVSLGVLDGRVMFGELAHIGGGFMLRGDRRIELAAVAAAEGAGVRGQTDFFLGRRLVLSPAISGGIWYDTFTEGGNNYWLRGGLLVGLREPLAASPTERARMEMSE